MVNHREVVIAPPQMARLIMAIVERRLEVMVEASGSEGHRIAEQREVEVNASVDLQFSYIISQDSQFARRVIMERLALRLAELRTDRDAVLIPRRSTGRIRQHVVA